jgi:ABC-2 type transport system permease protein
MTLFSREFKRNFKPLLIWTLAIGAIIFMLLSMFPEFNKQQGGLDAMLKSFPDAMLKAFNLDKIGYGTMLGFYSVQGYMMVTLVGSIYTAVFASGILSREETEKTAEFLLSKPVSRRRVIIEKLMGLFTNILLMNLILTVITVIGFQMDKSSEVNSKTFILLVFLAPVLLHSTFGAIAFFVSGIARKTRNSLSFSMGLVFVTYFLNIMAGISEKYSVIKYLTPFQYINTADIILGGGIQTGYIFVMLGIIFISVATVFWVYERKDIAV